MVTDKIVAGTYIITLSNTAKDDRLLQMVMARITTKVNEVFNEFAGNDWANTKLKSKKWKNDNTGDKEIHAIIK